MKTFEQYINESRQKYIFGGTDDRNTVESPKTFAELENGDIFYSFYFNHRSNNDTAEAEALEFDSIDNFFHPGGSASSIEFTRFGNKKNMSWYKVQKDELDNTTIVQDNGTSLVIISTDKNEFLEKIEELTGKKDIKIINQTNYNLEEGFK